MEASGGGSERRKSKRYAQQVVVQWQRPKAPDAPPTDEWRYAFIRDISKGGLCFESQDLFAVGDILYFKVKIHFALWPFNCNGQILRVRPIGKPGSNEIGVQFIQIDPKDADLIDLLAWEQDQKRQDPT